MEWNFRSTGTEGAGEPDSPLHIEHVRRINRACFHARLFPPTHSILILRFGSSLGTSVKWVQVRGDSPSNLAVRRLRLKEAIGSSEPPTSLSAQGAQKGVRRPRGKGLPREHHGSVILDVAHIGGGGAADKAALKEFYKSHDMRVPNEHIGGRVYLEMLNTAEDLGFVSGARLGWQCPNCNQREARAVNYEARRAVRNGVHPDDVSD